MTRYLQALAWTSLVASACWATERPIVFVSNEDSGTVSIIDGQSLKVVDEIDVGRRPRGMKVSADGKVLFVAVSGSPKCPPTISDNACNAKPVDKSQDGIALVNISERRVERLLPGGSDPEQFDISRNGKHLYVANEDAAVMSVVDRASGVVLTELPVGREPEGVRVSPDGGLVLVASESDNSIAVIDTSSHKLLASITVGRRPRAIVFNRDGSRAYVSCEHEPSIDEIDIQSMRRTRSISVDAGSLPMGIALTNDERSIIVAMGRRGTVAEIDLGSGRTVREVDVGTRPWGLALAPDGRRVFVANGPSNDVSVLKLPLELVRTLPVGRSPWGVVLSR